MISDESSSIPTDSRPPSPAAVPKVTQQEDEVCFGDTADEN